MKAPKNGTSKTAAQAVKAGQGKTNYGGSTTHVLVVGPTGKTRMERVSK